MLKFGLYGGGHMEEIDFLKKLMRSAVKKNVEKNIKLADLKPMLSSISKHKLEPYVQEMLPAVLPEIEEKLITIEEQYQNFVSFLKELQTKLEKPIVIVKGFSNYHNTNGRALLRGTSDLDILSHDPVKLREELLSQGFIEKKSETGHELSELKKDKILIDLHKFVPVASYPADINTISSSNNWKTKGEMYFSGQVTYLDIVENSVEILDKVLVPNVNMSLIISCAAIFRDYITTLEEVPSLKLINIVEIYILMHEPEFNREEFLKLIRKYHAEHSVAFTNKLLIEVYDEYLIDFQHDLQSFPQILFWDRKWLIPENLFKTVANTKFESVLEYLEAQKIQLNDNQKIELHIPTKTNDYHTSSNDFNKQIFLEVEWKENLYIRLNINDIKLHQNDIFSFNFGNYHRKIFLFGSKERGYSLFGERDNHYGKIINTQSNDSIQIEILIPHEEIDHYLINKNKLGMNVFIEKHDNNNQFSMYIPLIIIRAEEIS